MSESHGAYGSHDLHIRAACGPDLVYVMSLMRANRESVGGLPSPAIQERLDRGTVLLASINDDPVGYLLYDRSPERLRIPQACIQYDARRRKYGEALVAALLAQHADVDEISLRCAADLEANVFWRDMGFTCVGTSPGGRRRGRTINSWALWLTPRLLTVDQIAVLPAAEVRQDTMYDDSQFLRRAPEGFAIARQLPKLAWANRDGRGPRHDRPGISSSAVGDGVAGQVYDPFGATPAPKSLLEDVA